MDVWYSIPNVLYLIYQYLFIIKSEIQISIQLEDQHIVPEHFLRVYDCLNGYLCILSVTGFNLSGLI